MRAIGVDVECGFALDCNLVDDTSQVQMDVDKPTEKLMITIGKRQEMDGRIEFRPSVHFPLSLADGAHKQTSTKDDARGRIFPFSYQLTCRRVLPASLEAIGYCRWLCSHTHTKSLLCH